VHVQPEATTSAQAPFFAKQEYLIENLAIALPARYLLYVKEHPADVGRRGESFYGRFKYYPNVRLVDPSVNSKALIERCAGIITITGTVGFEAMFMEAGKPIIIFGDTFYDFHPSVTKVRDFTRLPDLFKKIQDGQYYKSEPAERTALAAAYLRSMYHGVVGSELRGFMEEANIRSVAASIEEFLDLVSAAQMSQYLRDYCARNRTSFE
jgi:hypothetical protein